MNKQEFLKGLESALLEQMNINDAVPHIRYYRDYIDNEITKGKTEEEVIASLQSPRLIAKTIIDNEASAKKYNNNVYGRENVDNYNKSQSSGEYTGTGFSFSINGKPVNGIIFKIILGIILFLIFAVVLVVLGGIFWIISRIVLPIVIIFAVIYFVIKFLKNNL